MNKMNIKIKLKAVIIIVKQHFQFGEVDIKQQEKFLSQNKRKAII